MREVIELERPHLIHAHSPVLTALAALQVAANAGLPVVYEVRGFWEDAAVSLGTSRQGGPRYLATRALETHALKRAAAVTAICEGLRNEILGRGLPPEKVTLIPNGVDSAAFPFLDRAQRGPEAKALLSQFGFEGKTVLGFFGSFYEYEGLELLVSAFADLMRSTPDARLLACRWRPTRGKH